MRIALDTNVLAYAEGTNGAEKRDQALAIIERLPPEAVVVPAQSLGELYNVLVRKAHWRPTRARTAAITWSDAYSVADTSASVMMDALELASRHGMSIWDSVMLAAASHASCRLLLSADLQDGFVWRGVTVANPFAETLHPLLSAIVSLRNR
jgi:predicted nucleic acid-binding protein